MKKQTYKIQKQAPQFKTNREYLSWLLGYNGADAVLRAPMNIKLEPKRSYK